MPKVYAYFRDTEARQEALVSGRRVGGDLFAGLYDLEERGWETDINLRKTPGTVPHHAGAWISSYLHRHGGYGGDFASCLATFRRANSADVVWSHADTLGIPLSLFKACGLLRPPLVYTSIGLVERFRAMPESRWKRRQLRALGRCAAFVGYGWEETEVLKQWFPECPVHFLPYGVDTERWKPLDRPKTVDVLSLGMDWQRDFGCLLPFARAHPDKRVKIITSRHLQSALGAVPENVELCDPVPLTRIPEEMASARVVALPVKENTYSGATTTLLQAMAMGLPVVVSEVGAIRNGYHFREKESCALVPPGAPALFAEALSRLLEDERLRGAIGAQARKHTAEDLNWRLFLKEWEGIFRTILMENPGESS
ncbi:MAG: glycosyltransferase family 4 protein [Kiritimatiellae bacterium]|nr:glycosyltransferase family 4 protein [Kiritimatiellia bacterium]